MCPARPHFARELTSLVAVVLAVGCGEAPADKADSDPTGGGGAVGVGGGANGGTGNTGAGGTGTGAGAGIGGTGAVGASGGCFAPDELPPTSAPSGFAIPDLEAERAAYQSFGWTWSPDAEPNHPAEPNYVVADPDIHDETEGDDLWSYLMMHQRTQEPGYLDRATAWAKYFKTGYAACQGADDSTLCFDQTEFGADHIYGWGLIAWASATGDQAALEEAEKLAEIVEQTWAGSNYGCYATGACTGYGLRAPGRHLLLATRVAEITKKARWEKLRDQIVDTLLTKADWDDAHGMYWASDGQTDYVAGEGAYASGIRLVSAFQIGVLTEAFDHAYRTTGRKELRDRMVKMAAFVDTYGLDPTYDFASSWFGIKSDQPWHNYSAEPPVTFWDPVYTTALVNSLMRGYRYTCDVKYLERAKHFFSRGNRGEYGELETMAPDGVVHHFVDTVYDSSTGNFYLAHNKGELQYTYLLFEPTDP